MFVANLALSIQLERSVQLFLLLSSPELILVAESSSLFPEQSLLDRLLYGLANFVLPSIIVAGGVLLLALFVWLYQGTIGEGSLGFSGIAENLLRLVGRAARGPSVSIEYRDLNGKRLDLGTYIHAVARHGRGGPAQLLGGAFIDCDPTWFTPGALVDVNVQDNLVREELVVEWDPDRNMLFVQSRYSFSRIVAKIHRRPEIDDAAE